jgi:hypothetical protein
MPAASKGTPSPTFSSPGTTPQPPTPESSPPRTPRTPLSPSGTLKLPPPTSPEDEDSDAYAGSEPSSPPTEPTEREPDSFRTVLTDTTALKRLFRNTFKRAGGIANRSRLTSGEEQDAGVWLTTPEERQGVANPAAALVHRNFGLDLTANVADLFEIGLALVDYLMRNVELRADVRAASYDANPDRTIEGDPA